MSEQKGEAAQSKKPVDNDFQQQRLRAWQPLLTPPYVIGTFAVIGVLFVIIGAVCLVASRSVVEVWGDYYENAPLQSTQTITVPSDMTGPIYFYYYLENFYQNHRRYVKSRSDAQLRSDSGSIDTSTCDPLIQNGTSKTYYPCGLIAASMFNDTYALSVNGGKIFTDFNGIAWETDVKDKFIPHKPTSGETTFDSNGVPLPHVGDPHFIVWMRTAGLPNFKKLWAILRDNSGNYLNLKSGDQITVHINSTFPVTGFSGRKRIVLSTTSWLGGKNDFLGIAYITVGALCIALSVIFLVKHKVSPRPLGDMRYFNWGTSSRPAQAS